MAVTNLDDNQLADFLISRADLSPQTHNGTSVVYVCDKTKTVVVISPTESLKITLQ